MTKENMSNLPKIGYVYLYPKMNEPMDKFRLDIFISATPTEKHFDVLRARFQIKNLKGDIEHLTVRHPWTFEKAYDVCPGLIVMEDRKGKKEEAFTFGGKLTINIHEMYTECNLLSSAPILEISAAAPVRRYFIDELEIVLAKSRAQHPDSHEFEAGLCDADSLDLYRSCLKELVSKYEHFPKKDEDQLELLAYLHSQEYRLSAAGLFKEDAPNLDELFEQET